MRIRISFSDYLNSAPLGWSFLYGPHRELFKVNPASPAHCADQLARGDVEIALIPSIEYERIPDLQIIPGIGVTAATTVRSVILIRHRGREIRSVGLDTNSRTSVVLVKLLLQSKMGLHPEFIPHAPDITEMMSRCDAALLIGDKALKVAREDYEIMDLAEAWIEWQEKPFVFAFWACRSDAELPENLVTTFHQAMRWGLQARPDIIRRYAKTLMLPEAYLLEYLSRNIDYEMGASHIEGLKRFISLAHASSLIPHVEPVRFVATPTEAQFPGQ